MVHFCSRRAAKATDRVDQIVVVIKALHAVFAATEFAQSTAFPELTDLWASLLRTLRRLQQLRALRSAIPFASNYAIGRSGLSLWSFTVARPLPRIIAAHMLATVSEKLARCSLIASHVFSSNHSHTVHSPCECFSGFIVGF